MIGWLSGLNDFQLTMTIIGGTCIFVGIGVVFLYLGNDPYKYRATRRRPIDPEPWMRDPVTGENLIVRPSADFEPHKPATDTRSLRRHREADTRGETTLIGPATIARARAMIPTPPPNPGDGLRVIRRRNTAPRAAMPETDRRSLAPDWRDAWIVTGAHPSVADTGVNEWHLPTDRTRAWWAGTYPPEDA